MPIVTDGLVRLPCPGDVYFDRTGCVSHSVPATYVILSGEPSDERHGGWEYRCWCARACNDEWMGGFVTSMWDTDIAKLELVGHVPMCHLRQGIGHVPMCQTCQQQKKGDGRNSSAAVETARFPRA